MAQRVVQLSLKIIIKGECLIVFEIFFPQGVKLKNNNVFVTWKSKSRSKYMVAFTSTASYLLLKVSRFIFQCYVFGSSMSGLLVITYHLPITDWLTLIDNRLTQTDPFFVHLTLIWILLFKHKAYHLHDTTEGTINTIRRSSCGQIVRERNMIINNVPTLQYY